MSSRQDGYRLTIIPRKIRQASELKPETDGTHIRAKKARADEARKEVSNLRRKDSKEVIIDRVVVDLLTRRGGVLN